LAAGGKALITKEYLTTRIGNASEEVSWTTGTISLPNETGTWKITGSMYNGTGGGIQFDSNISNDMLTVGHVPGGTPACTALPRIGISGGVGSFNIEISHVLGSTKWHVSGGATKSDGVSGIIFNGVKTTTGMSTILSLYDSTSVNLKVRRIS
jgi:hypothetical protein